MENQGFLSEMTPEELATHQELFSFFDKDDSGTIPTSSVISYMRGLGHCPTEGQASQIIDEFKKLEKENLTFEELLAMVTKRPKEQCIEEELIDAFESIQSYHGASGDGARSELIQVLALKKTLCDSGEALTEVQFDQFVDFLTSSGIKSNDQDFNFKSLAKILAYGYMES